ncbi:PREDICTED: subtilisin [Prunus dulcis]|uniref:PREDICTED: subtilisin n=1 Tax=Prunus dulcis TaxID=3755 RepID=A0A5E4FW09_PRUDU|nr:PREDICTED: subtilisin [Prunus dulcis]
MASIAAGNFAKEAWFSGYAKGIAKGVAPFAKLAIYKVGEPEGLSFPDIFAGILNKAIDDGVDVISLSLSPGNTGPTIGTLRNGYPYGS